MSECVHDVQPQAGRVDVPVRLAPQEATRSPTGSHGVSAGVRRPPPVSETLRVGRVTTPVGTTAVQGSPGRSHCPQSWTFSQT